MVCSSKFRSVRTLFLFTLMITFLFVSNINQSDASFFKSIKNFFKGKPTKGVSRSDSFIFKSYTVPPKPPRASMSSKPDTPTKVSPSELEKRKKYFDYGMGHVVSCFSVCLYLIMLELIFIELPFSYIILKIIIRILIYKK